MLPKGHVSALDSWRTSLRIHLSDFLGLVTSYERGCQEKNFPAAGYRVCFWTSSPDVLNVRARSASLFLRVVFSRKPAARTARSSEFVPLPCGFISLSRWRQSVP